MSRERSGFLLCALAAAGFGAMAIFGKLAYGAGAGVLELLAVRFVIATAVLAALAHHRGATFPRGRALAAGLALGALAYALEAGLFFGAFSRMDASVAELVLYAYPGLVVLGAVLLGRERATRRKLGALALGTAGVALVLLAGHGAHADALGALLALGAALGYTIYILTADTVSRRVEALPLATLVCTGAAVSFTLAGALSGSLSFDWAPEGVLWVVALAVVSTVVPIAAFLAGMERIGPGRASILSTLEPPVTLTLAFLVFGETLTPGQVAGAALVLAAVVVLQARGLRSPRRVAAAVPTRPAPAGQVREVAPVRQRVGV